MPAKKISTVKDAIQAEPLPTLQEIALELGCQIVDVRNGFRSEGEPDAVEWKDVIPESAIEKLERVKNLIRASNSVRQVGEAKQPEPQPEETKKKGGRLTKQRKAEVEAQAKAAQANNNQIVTTEQVLHAQKGARKGVRLAAIEIAAEESTYTQTINAALKRKIAVHAEELAQEENVHPYEILEQLGVKNPEEVLKETQVEFQEILGKSQVLTEDILKNSIANGYIYDPTALDDYLI